MVFDENFWRLTVAVHFKKNKHFKNVDLVILFSIDKL